MTMSTNKYVIGEANGRNMGQEDVLLAMSPLPHTSTGTSPGNAF